MWHAKQHEIEEGAWNASKGPSIVNSNIKARLYHKNLLAYVDYERTAKVGGNASYYKQIFEREAHALDEQIQANLIKLRMKKLGSRLLGLLK